jgi:hypothetical protein
MHCYKGSYMCLKLSLTCKHIAFLDINIRPIRAYVKIIDKR